jgi:hypothetical protein
MKELFAALGLVAVVAYFWMNPAVESSPEPRESRRPVVATAAAPANNPTRSAGYVGTLSNTDGSLANRWTKVPTAQTNLTATIPDRWKTGPNAQTDLPPSALDRSKTGAK